MRIIGRIIKICESRVKIMGKATGFIEGRPRYWVRCIDPFQGYKIGEEFLVLESTIKTKI